MNNVRNLKIMLGVLGFILVISLGFLGRALWLNYFWKRAVEEAARQAGGASASLDFRKGKMVLWVFEGTDINVRYSGRHDGPFEVWIDAYIPDYPSPLEYMRRKIAEEHNRELRYMYDHAEKFIANWKKEPRALRGESRPEDK